MLIILQDRLHDKTLCVLLVQTSLDVPYNF